MEANTPDAGAERPPDVAGGVLSRAEVLEFVKELLQSGVLKFCPSLGGNYYGKSVELD